MIAVSLLQKVYNSEFVKDILNTRKYHNELSSLSRRIDDEINFLKGAKIYPANMSQIAERMSEPSQRWMELMGEIPTKYAKRNKSLILEVADKTRRYLKLWDEKTFYLEWEDL